MTLPAYRTSDNKTWSYSTCIKQIAPGGLTIGNITYYSPATFRHQQDARCSLCDVVLDDVLGETYDLLSVAVSRGLVAPYSNTGHIGYISLVRQSKGIPTPP